MGAERPHDAGAGGVRDARCPADCLPPHALVREVGCSGPEGPAAERRAAGPVFLNTGAGAAAAAALLLIGERDAAGPLDVAYAVCVCAGAHVSGMSSRARTTLMA